MSSRKYFLTVAEFAERVEVSVTTAYTMLAEGYGPRFIRIRSGGAIRIPIVAFEEWVQGRNPDQAAS